MINHTYTFEEFINDKDMVYNATQAVGNEIANSIYYCYNFMYSFNFVVKTRLSLFSDFQDLWSSFMFNLLANSVSIKRVAEKIDIY